MDKSRGREVIRKYNMAHWPADMLPDELREVDYTGLVDKAVDEMTKGKKAGKKVFVRVAGQSGAGKSTQLMPMVEEYAKGLGIDPVMVTTRMFVPYHPHLKEIYEMVEEENVREATHEFAVQMLFESLMELMGRGYPILLDVTLLDAKIEEIVAETLIAEGYESEIQMMAVSKDISDEFIRKREKGSIEGKRKVRKGTSEEFMRATPEALKYYAKRMPETKITLWSAWDDEPVYEGEAGDPEMMEAWKKYSEIKKLPHKTDEDKLREAKKNWAKEKTRR